MKKMFLFAAMTSIALASCTTDEEIFAPINQGNEIEFVAANYAAQTRAEHADAEFTNSDYAVWAWKNGDNTPYMDSVKVDFTRGNKVDGTYYWPNYALDFAAVTPYGDKRISLDRTNGNSTITFTFDATNANTTTTNLMFADFVNAQQYDSDIKTNNPGTPTVALKFRHVLAKLNAVVHQVVIEDEDMPAGIENYNIVVNELSFNNLLCEGSLTINEVGYVANTNRLWTKSSDVTANWKIISDDTNIETSDFKTDYDHNDHNYLVMPQTLTDSATLDITYTVTTTFDAGTKSVETYNKSIKLKEIKNGANPITQWESNKNITYTINIKPADLTEIAFTVNEEEMGTIGGTHKF